MHHSAPQYLPAPAASMRVALAALSLAVLLPGIWGVSLTDRDEGWYAQVSREMWRSGDWWVPRYLGEPWLGKPPLLYWCVATGFSLLGTRDVGLARLVSVLAMAGAVQLLLSLAADLYGRRTAWLSAIVFLTAGLPAVIGRMVLTDALLLLTVVAAAWLLWRVRQQRRTWLAAAAFWICVSLGVLAKGPAVLLFVGAFAVATLWLQRRETLGVGAGSAPRKRTPYTVLLLTSPLAVLVAAPWYIYIAHHAGGTLTEQLIGYEILSRFTRPPHGHVGPPGYYLVISLAGWWPWTVLVPGAVLEAWRARRSDPVAGMLLIWCGLAWVLLELVPSKLPHYVLPCYVPLAILVGRMWEVGLERPTTPAQKRVLGLWAVVGILLGMLLLTLSARSGSSGPSLALAAGGLALVGTFATVGVLTARGRLAGAFGAVTAGTVLVYALGGLWLLPALEPYRFSRNIARTANALTTPGEPVLVCGYAEPSMFFYLEGPARVVAPHEIAAADGTVIIREAELSGLTLEPDEAWQRITGFNYVKGRDEVVWVGRVLK